MDTLQPPDTFTRPLTDDNEGETPEPIQPEGQSEVGEIDEAPAPKKVSPEVIGGRAIEFVGGRRVRDWHWGTADYR